MRWPLSRQILLPMVGILLLTIGVVSALNAWLASARIQRQIETQLADVARTLSASNFPLESNVLRQTRGLTGAEYVVAGADGKPIAASDDALAALVAPGGVAVGDQLDFHRVETAGSRSFVHLVAALDRRAVGGGQFSLHAFYPEDALREAQWQAVWPPLAIGGLAIVLVAAAAFVVARQVTQPIHQLRSQVERIAQGDFQPAPAPSRDDEIRELVIAVNQMAEKLAQYEEDTRQNERLRTLGTLGGGIAHQIRNAATGCRIALDLHQRDCPQAAANGDADQPLGVAVRQLELIETHIQRFLTLGRPPAARRETVELADVALQAIALVKPMARHLGVAIDFARPNESLGLLGDAESLEQMVVNLLINAVEATAGARVAAGGASDQRANEPVIVRLIRTSANACELAIGDPGPGPLPAIQSRLFQPFATDKPGGTGLGLVVAQQIAEDHGGQIRWERQGGRTWFIVELPLGSETLHGKTAGRR